MSDNLGPAPGATNTSPGSPAATAPSGTGSMATDDELAAGLAARGASFQPIDHLDTAGTDWAVGQLVSSGTNVYRVTTAHTGTFDVSKATSLGGLSGPSTGRNPLTGWWHADGYGAVADLRTVSTAAMTSASATVTATGAAFVAGDVGKAVAVLGAGAAGAALTTTIQSVTSSTVAVLAATAGTTVSGASLTISTDNTTFIQNAINASSTAGGGTVYVPQATADFGTTSGLVVKTGVDLRGSGRQGTRINCLGVLESNTIEVGQSTYTNRSLVLADSCSVKDLAAVKTVWQPRTQAQPGGTTIIITYASRASVERCEAFQSAAVGIMVCGDPGTYNSEISIKDNWVSYTQADGIGVFRGGDRVVVEGNFVKITGDDGISCNSYSGWNQNTDCVIRGNFAHTIGGNGIASYGSIRTRIEANDINGTEFSGVFITDGLGLAATGTLVKGNIINNVGTVTSPNNGITLTGIGTTYGIQAKSFGTGLTDIRFEGNRLTGMSSVANYVLIDGVTDLTLFDTDCGGSVTGVGIKVINSVRARIERNRVDSCTKAITVATTTGLVRLVNNQGTNLTSVDAGVTVSSGSVTAVLNDMNGTNLASSVDTTGSTVIQSTLNTYTGVAPLPGQGTLLVSENFTKSNGALAGTSPQTGPSAWVADLNGHQIVSNVARATYVNGQVHVDHVATGGTTAQLAVTTFTVPAAGYTRTYMNSIIDFLDLNNYIHLDAAASGVSFALTLYVASGGVENSRATNTLTTPVAGSTHTVAVKRFGNVITMYYDGVQVGGTYTLTAGEITAITGTSSGIRTYTASPGDDGTTSYLSHRVYTATS